MADKAGESTSWWQWLGDTATGLFTAKLGADVAIANNQANIAAAQQQQNETLSFLGYNLHKKTLLWVAGGVILTTFLLVLIKRR